MKRSLIVSLRMLSVLTLLTGVLYPAVMTLFAQFLFPRQANGSLIIKNGNVVGSELLSQDFSSEKYFHARPSAIGWNPAPSGGTNWGPTDKRMADSAAARTKRFRDENGLAADVPVPPEMIFASASGVDPHIGPDAALLQVNRVARARGLDSIATEKLRTLVVSRIEGPQFGLFGMPRVNVLLLNRALDAEWEK